MCELPGGETRCLCQLADCRRQRGVWSQGHLGRTPTCFSCGDWTLKKMVHPAEIQLQPVLGGGLPEHCLHCASSRGK